MKKKLLNLVLSLLLIFIFASCGNNVNTDTSTNTDTEASTVTETKTETESEETTDTETETEETDTHVTDTESTETESETETDIATEIESETETEPEVDSETDTETETATDTAIETETVTDTETESEEDLIPVNLLINDEESFVGCITFEISLDHVSGEYILQLADVDKATLPYYSNIARDTLSEADTAILIESLVMPKACKYIKMTTEEDEYFLEIPEEYTIKSEEEYRFGALSDVHYNKGDFFDSALNFLDKKGVDFVAVAGDLTNDGELEYLEKFNAAIKDREYKVYTVSGNHDAKAMKNGSWLENINTGIKSDAEVVEIAENGLDFVYKPNGLDGDVFIFLCQVRWEYFQGIEVDTSMYSLLDKSQLDWLRGVLEEYKNNTVFLFFHTFLSDSDGTAYEAVGNLHNQGGYEYPLPYTYGVADEVEFRNLLKEYKNVVFFSGHSHWMFELESINENLNFSNFDGEYSYMVHVPSVCEPRWIGENDISRTSKTGKASEGWIVEVYDEAIIFTPVDFISEIYYTEYMKIIPLK